VKFFLYEKTVGIAPAVFFVFLPVDESRIIIRFARFCSFKQVRIQLDVLPHQDRIDDRTFSYKLDLPQEKETNARGYNQQGTIENRFDIPPFLLRLFKESIHEQIDRDQDEVGLNHEKESKGQGCICKCEKDDFCVVDFELYEAGQHQI
jgi:hypothetical protein